MWDIKAILKDFYKTKDFQEFINHRFKDDSMILIPKNVFINIFKYISTDYARFYSDDMFYTISGVEDYSLDDLRPNDIVLDIGACIGAFSIKVANKVKRVYAVEPILAERLKQNIEINNINNISVLEYALGNGELNLNWVGHIRRIEGTSFSEILKKCGGHIDFLKCDCEGGEWSILPDDLKHIRRIEAEIHCFHGEQFFEFESILKKAGFTYEKEILSEKLMIIHGKKITEPSEY